MIDFGLFDLLNATLTIEKLLPSAILWFSKLACLVWTDLRNTNVSQILDRKEVFAYHVQRVAYTILVMTRLGLLSIYW